jgi:hypothetical protein
MIGLRFLSHLDRFLPDLSSVDENSCSFRKVRVFKILDDEHSPEIQ